MITICSTCLYGSENGDADPPYCTLAKSSLSHTPLLNRLGLATRIFRLEGRTGSAQLLGQQGSLARGVAATVGREECGLTGECYP
jgi:hypothetical protein